MGWTWTELYNLPVYLRRYYYLKLVNTRKKENEAEKEAYEKASPRKR